MREMQFDGIVGPTHNYAGLSPGNLASQAHGGTVSNPRAAARQGLAKMRLVRDLGVPQAVLPPQDRPSLGTLRSLGFVGSDEEVSHRSPRVFSQNDSRDRRRKAQGSIGWQDVPKNDPDMGRRLSPIVSHPMASCTGRFPSLSF